MNPDRVWREVANDALAHQIESEKYGLFVAMPFRDQFSYRFEQVFDGVITPAVSRANAKLSTRQIGPPVRADKMAASASSITEEIVERILFNHLFIADLTLANHGALVELGVALSLKPSRQVIAIMQGKFDDLHFDIQENRILSYNGPDAIDLIADALVAAANAFEATSGSRMAAIRSSLSPTAVYLLNRYGQFRKQHPGRSLHADLFADDPNVSADPAIRRLLFHSAAQELLSRRLLELDYRVAERDDEVDRYGLHATKLGLAFIRQTWNRALGDLT